MNQFDIHPINRYNTGQSASIRRPKVCKNTTSPIEMQPLTSHQEIASFSYDDAHEFHLDDRLLRYYYPPTIGADLSKGQVA